MQSCTNPTVLFIVLPGHCLLFIEFSIGYAQEGGLIQVRELTFPPTPAPLKSERKDPACFFIDFFNWIYAQESGLRREGFMMVLVHATIGPVVPAAEEL